MAMAEESTPTVIEFPAASRTRPSPSTLAYQASVGPSNGGTGTRLLWNENNTNTATGR